MFSAIGSVDKRPACLDNGSFLAKYHLAFLVNKKFQGSSLLEDFFHNEKTLIPGKTI